MENMCRRCRLEITSNDTSVTCSGFCEEITRYHCACVGIKVEESIVLDCPNVYWMCDFCRDLMDDLKFRSIIKSLECTEMKCVSEVECLKLEMAKMSTTLSRLVKTVESGCVPLLSESTPISEDQNETTKSNVSLPLTSTKIMNGASNRPADIVQPDDIQRSFQLFVTNIANNVTEREISVLTSQVIGTSDEIKVKRLVPSWKDASTLDYVSFKIDMPFEFRTRALNVSNWPQGIRCREFKRFSCEAVWHPDIANVNLI